MKAETGLISIIRKAVIVISFCLVAFFSYHLTGKTRACLWLKPDNLFEARFLLTLVQKLTEKNIYPIYTPDCPMTSSFIIADEMLQNQPFQTIPVFLTDFGKLKFFSTNNNAQYVHLFYFDRKKAPVLPDYLEPSLASTYISPVSLEKAAEKTVSFILDNKWLNFYIFEEMGKHGLGNQMFAYASCFSYAKRFHKKLLWYNSGIINAFQTNWSELLFYRAPFIPTLKRKLTQLHNQITDSSNFNESLHFRSDIVSINGYHQAYKNIEDSVALIQEKLKFKPLTEKENIKWAQKLQSQNSVCLHVRLGDYVWHGYPDLSRSKYYQNAVDYILKQTQNPTFYVFSNDSKKAEKKLKINVPFEVVRVNQYSSDFRDMQLMSLCKHNIIANSTFSWWAALLNKNPDKIVTYPDIWDPWHQNWLNYMRVPGWIEIESGITYHPKNQKLIYPSLEENK